MSEDFVETMDALRQDGRDRRAKHRAYALEKLHATGLRFTIHNAGAHLVVAEARGAVVDYWPGTGRWIVRGGGGDRGIGSLLTWLDGANGDATIDKATIEHRVSCVCGWEWSATERAVPYTPRFAGARRGLERRGEKLRAQHDGECPRRDR